MNLLKSLFVLCGSALLASCGDSTPVNPAPQTPSAAAEGQVASAAAASTPAPEQSQLVLAPFGGSLENVTSSDDCALDGVDGTRGDAYSLYHTKRAQLSGWAADRKLSMPPNVAQLILQGSSSFSADLPINQPRPDVAKALGKAEFAYVGYNASLDLSAVAPGNYRLVITYPGPGQAGVIACSPKTAIRVL